MLSKYWSFQNTNSVQEMVSNSQTSKINYPDAPTSSFFFTQGLKPLIPSGCFARSLCISCLTLYIWFISGTRQKAWSVALLFAQECSMFMEASIYDVIAPIYHFQTGNLGSFFVRAERRWSEDLHRVQSISVIKVFHRLGGLYNVCVSTRMFSRELIPRFPHHSELN